MTRDVIKQLGALWDGGNQPLRRFAESILEAEWPEAADCNDMWLGTFGDAVQSDEWGLVRILKVYPERSQSAHCYYCCLSEQAVDTYRMKGSRCTSPPQPAEVATT